MDENEMLFGTVVGGVVLFGLVFGASRLIEATKRSRGTASARVLEIAFLLVTLVAAVVAPQLLH